MEVNVMKHKIIYILALLSAAAFCAACTPEDLTPAQNSGEPLTSVTAYVTINGQEAEFTGYPDEDNRVEIVFPYYYPVETDYKVTTFFLEDVKVIASLANNVVIEEPINRMDLTLENVIHLVDQTKHRQEYVITGAIKHLSLADIFDLKYTVSEKVFYNAIINGDEIMIPNNETLPDGVVTFTLSPHATAKKADGSPLRSGDTVNFDQETYIIVVADDGSEHRYRVFKGSPMKRDKGINTDPDFVNYMFARKLNSEVGIPVYELTTGLAVSGDYLIINTRGQDPVVLDRFTGANVGTIALPDELKVGKSGNETLRNFYMTSDKSGNILITNLVLWQYGDADAGIPGQWRDLGEVKIWRLRDINDTPEEYISWPISEENVSLTFGRKLSVTGSLDSDAVIVLPNLTYPSTSGFYQWTVKGGELVSAEPEWITVADGAYFWNNNIDIVRLSPEPDADYIAFGYSDTARQPTWFNGRNNSIKQQIDLVDVNYVPNALDVLEFNGITYLAAIQLNSFTWGRCDFAWLFDLTLESNFQGILNAQGAMGLTADCPAMVWSDISGTWGPHALEYASGGYSNGNQQSDVILAGSESGYYMYMYFMFCNGYVVGVQFDCISRGGE